MIASLCCKYLVFEVFYLRQRLYNPLPIIFHTYFFGGYMERIRSNFSLIFGIFAISFLIDPGLTGLLSLKESTSFLPYQAFTIGTVSRIWFIVWILANGFSFKTLVVNLKTFSFFNITCLRVLLLTVINLIFSVSALLTFVTLITLYFPESVGFINKVFSETVEEPLFIQIMNCVMPVFVTPILEEVVFRKIIVDRLCEYVSLKRACIYSAFIFSILHTDMIGAFLFAIIASILYIKFKDLKYPILMHMLNNMVPAIATAYSLYTGTGTGTGKGEGTGSMLTLSESQGIFNTALSVTIISGIIIAIYIIRNRKVFIQQESEVSLLPE